MAIGRPRGDEHLRFDSKVRIGAVPAGFDEPCWLWTGAPNRNGYAQFQIGGRSETRRLVGVHRYSYERHVGPIPDGYHVDHLCRVPLCVNPTHLEAVPPAVNNERSDSPTARNKRMTYCKRGLHELPTQKNSQGERRCRPCVNEYQRRRRANRQEIAA